MMRTIHNIMMRLAALLALALLTPTTIGATDIYPKNDVPNGYYFYPLPCDTLGVTMFMADVYKYNEAKKLRNSVDSVWMAADVVWGPDSMLSRQVPGFGYQPDTASSPVLYWLIKDSYDVFSNASRFKSMIKRVRPCRRFRENTYAVESATSSSFLPGKSSEFSFPSSHASTSWGIALELMCVNPWKADTIVNRGLAHSQSRVMGGVHWQSDVDAGKVLATANYARIYSIDSLITRLDNAREETRQLLGMAEFPTFDQLYACDDTLSLLTEHLAGPYAMDTPVGYSEIAVLLDRTSKATAAEIASAKQQVSLETADILSCFSTVMGKTITAESHPAVYALVDMHLRMCRKMCLLMQSRYTKPRPWQEINISPLTGEDIDSLEANCSYPSLHSAMGWTASLVLMPLLTSNQHNILKQGVDYGENRIAAGVSWPGDVEIGRMLASIAYGYTTSCRDYGTMVRQAVAEFNQP